MLPVVWGAQSLDELYDIVRYIAQFDREPPQPCMIASKMPYCRCRATRIWAGRAVRTARES